MNRPQARPLLILVALLAFNAHADSSPEAIAQLKALQFPVDTPVGFSEQLYNPMLDAPLHSSGEVWLESSGAMVMQMQQPRPEQRRLLDNTLTLSRPAGKRQHQSMTGAGSVTQRSRQVRLKPERGSHMILLAAAALLHGQHDWLLQHFTLSLALTPPSAPNEDEQNLPATPLWELLLVPMDAKLREQLTWIRLRGSGTHLSSLRADRSNKGWQQLEFFAPAD